MFCDSSAKCIIHIPTTQTQGIHTIHLYYAFGERSLEFSWRTTRIRPCLTSSSALASQAAIKMEPLNVYIYIQVRFEYVYRRCNPQMCVRHVFSSAYTAYDPRPPRKWKYICGQNIHYTVRRTISRLSDVCGTALEWLPWIHYKGIKAR